MQYFPSDAAYKTLLEFYDETLNVIQDAIMCDGISILEVSVDGNSLRFAASRTSDRDLLKGLTLSVGTGIVGRVVAESKGVISNRADSHPDFFALPDQVSDFKTRSILCCPLRCAGQVVGAIELVNKTDRQDFGDGELELIQALADDVGDWRCEMSAPRRETFYELTRRLRKVVDVEGISLFTLDEAGENLRLRYSDTTRGTELQGIRLGMDQGVAGAVASHRQPLLVPSVQKEPRFFKGVDAVSMFSTHSIVAAPVLDGDRLLAVVELVNARGSESFTDRDRETLEAIAAEMSGPMAVLSR